MCSIGHCLIVREYHYCWSSNYNASLCVTICCLFNLFLRRTPALHESRKLIKLIIFYILMTAIKCTFQPPLQLYLLGFHSYMCTNDALTDGIWGTHVTFPFPSPCYLPQQLISSSEPSSQKCAINSKIWSTASKETINTWFQCKE
jgi:hypothetical protein